MVLIGLLDQLSANLKCWVWCDKMLHEVTPIEMMDMKFCGSSGSNDTAMVFSLLEGAPGIFAVSPKQLRRIAGSLRCHLQLCRC